MRSYSSRDPRVQAALEKEEQPYEGIQAVWNNISTSPLYVAAEQSCSTAGLAAAQGCYPKLSHRLPCFLFLALRINRILMKKRGCSPGDRNRLIDQLLVAFFRSRYATKKNPSRVRNGWIVHPRKARVKKRSNSQ